MRAEALSWDNEWDKARKLVFSFISTLSHGGLLRTPLTSLVSRRKSRFAEKKSASPKKNKPVGVGVGQRVYQGGMSLPVVACHDRPSRGSWLWLRLSPSFARLRLACMELSTICHLRWRLTPRGNLINTINSRLRKKRQAWLTSLMNS